MQVVMREMQECNIVNEIKIKSTGKENKYTRIAEFIFTNSTAFTITSVLSALTLSVLFIIK